MLKAKIQKGERATIEATGSTMEIMADILVLINSIHTQFQSADPGTAAAFRLGLSESLSDPNSSVWKAHDGQTGIIFHKPEQED